MLKLCFSKCTSLYPLAVISGRLKQFSQTPALNVSSFKTRIVPAPTIKPETYMARNTFLKRPLSPHLTIYKMQMSSMMSISVRMTGLALGIMAWVVCLTKLLSGKKVEDFVDILKGLELDDCYWTAAKTIAVFPFSFHFVAGLRHLLFDTAKLLEKKQFFATGCVALVLAFALTLTLGMMEDIREKLDEIQYTGQLEEKKK